LGTTVRVAVLFEAWCQERKTFYKADRIRTSLSQVTQLQRVHPVIMSSSKRFSTIAGVKTYLIGSVREPTIIACHGQYDANTYTQEGDGAEYHSQSRGH
jgi:hypothetical protein